MVTVSFLTLLNAISGVGVFFLFGFLTAGRAGLLLAQGAGDQGRQLQDITAQVEGRKVPGQAVR